MVEAISRVPAGILVPDTISHLGVDKTLTYEGVIDDFAADAQGFTVSWKPPQGGFRVERRCNTLQVKWSIELAKRRAVQVLPNRLNVILDRTTIALPAPMTCLAEVPVKGFAVRLDPDALHDVRNVFFYEYTGVLRWQIQPNEWVPDMPWGAVTTSASGGMSALTAFTLHNEREYGIDVQDGSALEWRPSW